MPDTPPALLAAALARDPAGPLLTYYDDATGERIELSATTLANWVAKSANLMADELDIEPGELVCVLLPAHWQTAVVLLSLWSLGAIPIATPEGAEVIVADEPSIPSALAEGKRAVLGLSLAPMNAPLAGVLATVLDFAAEVLGAGDVFVGVEPSGETEAAAARSRATEVGMVAGDRILAAEEAGLAGAIDWLLAPLAAETSIVLCRHVDESLLPRRVLDERVTATWGVSVLGVRRLDS